MPGPIDSIKGAFVKALLGKMVDGDHGSTILGVIAAALVGANLDWGLMLQGFHDQRSAMECGKFIAIAVMAIWGYFIGKKKKPDAA